MPDMLETFVLPGDVRIASVRDLPASVREDLECGDEFHVVTRPRGRTASRLIDADARRLLEQFRTPRRIVDVVLELAEKTGDDPEQMLKDAFPMLEMMARSGLLVPPTEARSGVVEASLKAGDTLDGFEIVSLVQLLEDSEIYRARSVDAQDVAVKLARSSEDERMAKTLKREAGVLERLGGEGAPSLVGHGKYEDGRPYLAMSWIEGRRLDVWAADARSRPSGRQETLDVCRMLARAYADLHERTVIHSDVHPGNVLVGDSDVRLIDFGLARIDESGHPLRNARRGAIPFFFEPEYASRRLQSKRAPHTTRRGEQYAVGAAMYFAVTGAHYIDFRSERTAMYEQIVEEPPRSFESLGLSAWPSLERVLGRMLEKKRRDRFANMGEVFEALLSVIVPEAPATPKRSPLAVPSAPPRPATLLAPGPASSALLDDFLASVRPGGELFDRQIAPPDASITYGSAGIALSLYRIALIRGDSSLLSLADVWLSQTRARIARRPEDGFTSSEMNLTRETVGWTSIYHAESGVHFVQALISQAMGDFVTVQNAVDEFIEASLGEPNGLDLTLGRAATLMGVSLLLDALPPHPLLDLSPLRVVGRRAAEEVAGAMEGREGIRESRAIRYTGIAHGWGGLLYSLLLWSRSSGEPHPSWLGSRVEELAQLGDRSGSAISWPRKIGRRPSDHHPSWCNGTAGLVALWRLASEVLDDTKFSDIAIAAGHHVRDHPDQMVDLCCGLAGRAYALLLLDGMTSDRQWGEAAADALERAAISCEGATLRAKSLYKGEIGIAVATAELANPGAAAQPAFHAERWEWPSANECVVSAETNDNSDGPRNGDADDRGV